MQHESELARLRDDRPFLQDVVALALDGIEDGLPAAGEELDVGGEVFRNFSGERQAKREPLARTRDLELHHLDEPGSSAALGNIFFRDLKAAQVGEWDIDASLLPVTDNVLPEISKLERGAGVVGKLLAFGVAVSAEVEHEVPHGVRGILAVAKHVVEGLVPRS